VNGVVTFQTKWSECLVTVELILHKYLPFGRISVWSKLIADTVMLSDSYYVKRSVSLQWFRLKSTLVGGIWCVGKVGDHHGQEIGLKCDFDSRNKTWTFTSGSLLCKSFRKRHEETAWKRRRIETSLVIVILWYVCWRMSFLISCFGIELVLCDLHLTRFDLTKGF